MDASQDPEGLEQSARAAHRTFAAAMRGGDWATASVAYAVDARLLAPSADVIEGRSGIAAYWRAGLDAGIRAVELVPLRIDGRGSVAFEIGHYAIRLRPPDGGCVVDRGTYLVVHERGADGRWAWALETFTPEGLPQVAPGAAGDQASEVGDDE